MKKLSARLPKWAKTLILTLLSIAVAGGGIYGVLLLIRGNEAVKVYALEDVGQYTSSGNAQTEGIVTADRVQSVYISNTQEVTKIHVKEGQKVAVGDELITFDTTLTDLALERKDIAVRQLELDLEKARTERHNIECYHLYDPNKTEPEPEEPTLKPGNVGQPWKGSGSKESPLQYLWNSECKLSDAFLSELAQTARKLETEQLYVVFETRRSDSTQGAVENALELILTPVGEDDWSVVIITPDYDDTPEPIEDAEEEEEEEDDGLPSYTWSELQNMRKEADRKIQQLEIDLAMARVELESVRHELESGTVKSTVNGVVKSVITVEEARSENAPLILVSGGGGYLVTGAMSETELEAMHVGDTVSVLSWENYETYEGTISSISEFPDTSNRYYHYSEGNQNVSLYPFTVTIGEDAKLREGEYVQMSYNPGGEGLGYFVQNPFVRSENGRSYVWAAGEKGLEKRYVTTGSSLWGSYIQITGGIDGVQYLAFPYGRALRQGQKTETAGIDALYGY